MVRLAVGGALGKIELSFTDVNVVYECQWPLIKKEGVGGRGNSTDY